MRAQQVRVIVSLGLAQTIAWGSSYYLPAILANPIARELRVGTPWIFIAFSCGLLISGFLGPLSGNLIDRFGGHKVLPASNVLFAIALALLGLANSQVSLIASWLLMGVAMSCGLYEAAFSTLARIYGANARRAITGITLIAGFASTIAWPLTAWLESTLGWRAACFTWALAHLLICLPLDALLPAGARVAQAAAHAKGATDTPPKGWTMAALAIVFAATWFGSTAMAAHLPRLLQQAGATLPAAIAAAALVGPAQVAGRVMEFWLMRRVQPITSARVAALMHPVGAGVLILAGAPAAPVFTLLHGAGNGVMTIANGTLPLQLFGAAGYGLRQGVLMMPARFMQAAAPFVFDILLSRFGIRSLALTAALGIVSFMALSLLAAQGKGAAGAAPG